MKTRLLLSGGILAASLGLAGAASAQTISSAANQTFVVADPSTPISPITITDKTPPSIKGNKDIRVRIPAGLNMTWDPTITTATITGSGASKVSTTVSYGSGNLDLVINVVINFAAGDQITVSGLNFRNFTAPSAASSLGLIVGDIADSAKLAPVLRRVDSVMHFAAHAYVGESVQQPARYYQNNLVNTIGLLDLMRRHDIRRFVFSSTCAIYGVPGKVARERTRTSPSRRTQRADAARPTARIAELMVDQEVASRAVVQQQSTRGRTTSRNHHGAVRLTLLRPG